MHGRHPILTVPEAVLRENGDNYGERPVLLNHTLRVKVAAHVGHP